MEAAKDDVMDHEARHRAITDTARKLAEGSAFTGWPRFAELIDEKVVKAVKTWLDLDTAKSGKTIENHCEQSGQVASVCERQGILVPMSMADLVRSVRQAPDRDDAVIPGFFHHGASLLIGDPKSGKSLLALQALIAVSNGKDFLGAAVRRGKALFLSLEDDENEIERRVAIMDPEITCGTELKVLRKICPWYKGGKAQLKDVLAGIDLVVIDTAAAFGMVGRGQRDQSAYVTDYEPFAELKELAASNNTAVLVLHHTAKARYDDPIHSVNGTQGMTGAVNTVLVMSREKGGTRRLDIRGKRRNETLTMDFDEETLLFHLMNKMQPELPDAQRELSSMAQELQHFTVADLASHLGITVGAAKKQLQRWGDRLGIVKAVPHPPFGGQRMMKIDNPVPEAV